MKNETNYINMKKKPEVKIHNIILKCNLGMILKWKVKAFN